MIKVLEKVSDYILQFILSIVKGILNFLPRKLSLLLGSIFAKLIYSLSLMTPYRNHIQRNIKETLPIPESWAHKEARIHIIKLVKNIVDFLRISKIRESNFDKIIEIKNPEYFEEALKENKGIILVSAHYGCWELLGVALKIKFNNPLSVIVQRPSSPVFDKLFYNSRKFFGINTYYNTDGIQGLRPLFRALENNETIGFLIDQHGESEDTFGRFFGKVVSIPSGPAVFAYRTKAPILPVFIKRLKNDKHEIVFLPHINIGNEEKNIEIYKTSQKLYGIIEKFIKDNPDEWLWIYRRWNKLSQQGMEIAENIEKHVSKEFSYEKN
jgi:lauroyl/myristoyl acyltransferase